MSSENIILTGFMGTGKTAAGRALAARAGRPFVDTDEWIVERAGKSIAAIFADDGEARFRDWERRAVDALAGERGLVIATGGRLMLDPDNAARLGRTGPTFCLTAAPETILARLASDGGGRPLLDGPNPAARVRALLNQRAAGYARFRAVDTGGKTAAEVAAEIEALLADGLRERLPVVHPEGQYDVVIGSGLLPEALALAGGDGPLDPARAAVVTDDGAGPHHAARLGPVATVITLPAGEQHKTLDSVRLIYDRLLAAGLDRAAVLFGLGGGVVGDMAGFAAATYLRGVGFALCPTSLLAMVDASVGGKTGVDLPQGKNLVGAFKQPVAVIADIATLGTLPAAEFTAGLAEVAKSGLIADPVLWQRLMIEEWTRAPAAYLADPLARMGLQTLVAQTVRVKRDVVEEDPFERSRRAALNLGHTFGHAIEQVSGYTIRHGEAVAMGLVGASRLSARLGHCSPSLPNLVEAVLARLGLPTHTPPGMDVEAVYAAMFTDKKKRAGRLRFVLLRDIGDVFISDDVAEAAVLETLAGLRA
jgi:3-dehydroquinate synthase